jgi:hypothetical protein
MVAGVIHGAFVEEGLDQSPARWRGAADELRVRLPKKSAALMGEAEDDVQAMKGFPKKRLPAMPVGLPWTRNRSGGL